MNCACAEIDIDDVLVAAHISMEIRIDDELVECTCFCDEMKFES